MTDTTCVWCGHPTDVHYDGGCQISAHSDEPQCGCSHDADWLGDDNPDPPRGDE
jgi:hypothetical protein